MAEHTPTESIVRVHYAVGRLAMDGALDAGSPMERDAEFDRWLAVHDREVAARAWDEGARSRQCHCEAWSEGECGCGFWPSEPNPYRAGNREGSPSAAVRDHDALLGTVPVTPQQERLRREMVGDGLDPTNAAHREMYENSLQGASPVLDESLRQWARALPPWWQRVLDWFTRILTRKGTR